MPTFTLTQRHLVAKVLIYIYVLFIWTRRNWLNNKMPLNMRVKMPAIMQEKKYKNKQKSLYKWALPKCKCRFSGFYIGQVFSKSHASLLVFSTLTDETQIQPILFVSHLPGLPMQVQTLPQALSRVFTWQKFSDINTAVRQLHLAFLAMTMTASELALVTLSDALKIGSMSCIT